jgi:hypothetical protein
LANDSTATLRVTAYRNGALVGTNASTGSEPFTWPSSTRSFSAAQGFNSVVIHYASPPPTGGDYGVIFVADNMTVTATVVPEPCTLRLLAAGLVASLGVVRRHLSLKPYRTHDRIKLFSKPAMDA